MRWFEGGVQRADLNDQFSFEQSCSGAESEAWKVELQYLTPEVRIDPKNLLFAETSFVLPACGDD